MIMLEQFIPKGTVAIDDVYIAETVNFTYDESYEL